MTETLKQDSLLQQQRYWSDQYGRELSISETEEIIRNLSRFFEVLARADRKHREKPSGGYNSEQ